MMEGGGHRRRKAWGAFLFRSAPQKGPPRLWFLEGNSNCRSREGIVVAEHQQQHRINKTKTSAEYSADNGVKPARSLRDEVRLFGDNYSFP